MPNIMSFLCIPLIVFGKGEKGGGGGGGGGGWGGEGEGGGKTPT